MIKHYIKIAWRNLTKYKTQNLIALLALAIGFTGFSLCLYWIKYEMSYDTFQKDADRIYLVGYETDWGPEMQYVTYPLLASYLTETFPEIEESCNIRKPQEVSINYHSVRYETTMTLLMDKRFLDFFDIRLLSGSYNFLTPGSNEVAITDKLAKKIFGNQEALGESIEITNEKYTIGAIVNDFESHSNLSLGILAADYKGTTYDWNSANHFTFIRRIKGSDPKQFAKKIGELEINKNSHISKNYFVTSLTAIWDNNPFRNIQVKFHHILLFTIACGLVLFCAILNYLTLFVCRLHIRGKEFALRKTCGSSYGSLRNLFIFEFGIILWLSILFGLLVSEIILPSFKELTGIESANSYIYLETFLFSIAISIITLLISALYIHFLNKRTIYSIIKGTSQSKKTSYNQKSFITIQLIISILFIFCTSVAIRQFHLLTQSDKIVHRAGRGFTMGLTQNGSEFRLETDLISNILQSNPYVTEILPSHYLSLLPYWGGNFPQISDWEGKAANKEVLQMQDIWGDETFCKFYNIRLIKGNFFSTANPDHVLINETAWREFGWDDPIGKYFFTGYTTNNKKMVVGVVEDFYTTVPTIPVKPVFISPGNSNNSGQVLFKYREGFWKECKMFVEEQIYKNHPEITFWIKSADKAYDEQLESENALILLLDFVSIICIIISMFGVYSIVSLDSVSRQKEMAIRKINGAGAIRITGYFLKRYLIILGLAALIAFPIGYYIMKSWLQTYLLQTPVTIWYYIAILAGLILMICICISSSLVKVIRVNPVEILKTE